MARKSAPRKTDEVQEITKKPKGFYCLLDRVEGTYTTKGYSTFAKALYDVQRYWSQQPYTQGVSIMIEEKLLYYMDVATRKETYMSVFDDYRKNYVKQNGRDMDSVPSLKADDRKIFIRAGMPFRLGKETSTVDGGVGGSSIVYRVKVDTSSPEYKAIGVHLNLAAEYGLWVKANDARIGQYNQIIRPMIDESPDKLYILVKPEDSKDMFDFQFYTPGKPVVDLGDMRVDFDPFASDLP